VFATLTEITRGGVCLAGAWLKIFNLYTLQNTLGPLAAGHTPPSR